MRWRFSSYTSSPLFAYTGNDRATRQSSFVLHAADGGIAVPQRSLVFRSYPRYGSDTHTANSTDMYRSFQGDVSVRTGEKAARVVFVT